MISAVRAVRTAFTWLTVLPVAGRDVSEAPDRALGGAVMASVPVIGVALGAAVAGLALALSYTGFSMVLIGVLLVATLAALTRGMHLDGLADTADGLGCYGPPERVTEVMRSGTVGPFGVATLVLTLGVQAAGFAGLTDESRWYAIAFAIAVGRLGAVVATRRSLTPAHPDGFGALVAGTQRVSVAVWCGVALLAALPLGLGGNGFDAVPVVQGAGSVVAVVVFTWLFTRHCSRRMGGVTGDVLGATIELGVAIALLGLLL